MFLFYVLSINLCLSSVSTCICVIFNPVGTFRTIANYILYALGLSILLTYLFVPLTSICFDDPVLPQSPELVESGDGIPLHEEGYQMSAPYDTVDATVVKQGHDEVSTPDEVEEATLTLDARREVSAQPPLLAQPAKGECSRHAFPPVEKQAMAISKEDSTKQSVDAVTTAKGIPRFCEQPSASPEEMGDANEPKENKSRLNSPQHIETPNQGKPTTRVITARESKKIDKWINQTNFARTDADEAFCGMLKGEKGDDTTDEDPSEEKAKIMLEGRDNGDAQSMIYGSDFQIALRVYMGKKMRCGRSQRRSGRSSPSSGSTEESDFQGSIRKMFRLENVGGKMAGGKRRARSA